MFKALEYVIRLLVMSDWLVSSWPLLFYVQPAQVPDGTVQYRQGAISDDDTRPVRSNSDHFPGERLLNRNRVMALEVVPSEELTGVCSMTFTRNCAISMNTSSRTPQPYESMESGVSVR